MAAPKGVSGVDLIPVENVEKSKRGRTAVTDPKLIAVLQSIQPGFAGVVKLFGATADKTERQAVSADIRKHWKIVHGEDSAVTINWSPTTNLPQVQHKASK